ncbi:MAG: DUF2961 domain-containing protein [Planctomycetes bacterium]|nr:DUF2961 domain-containing protein [Planctomycetota bacterium]
MSLLLPSILLSAALAPQGEVDLDLPAVLDRIQHFRFLAEEPAEGEGTLRFAAAGTAEPDLSEAEVELFSADGPGILGRLMIVRPAGDLNFYFDGLDEPAISMPARQFFSLQGPFQAPLTIINGRAGIMRAPIPFAKSLRVTTTQKSPRFEAGVHLLASGTSLVSASTQRLGEVARTIERIAREIAGSVDSERWRTSFGTGSCNSIFPFDYDINGNGIVHWFSIRFISQDRITPEEMAEYMRSMRIEIVDRARVKGSENVTASVPFGDFFGTAPDITTWRSDVLAIDSSTQTFTCRFPIPYTGGFGLRLKSLRKMEKQVRFKFTIGFEQLAEPPAWRFHAGFFQKRGIRAGQQSEVPVGGLTGAGRLVGLSLTGLYSGQQAWDEGGLQILADGVALETGKLQATELFDRTTRRDGPASFGYTARNRFWVHDPVQFQEELTVAFELGAREEAELGLEGVAYWYAPADQPNPFPVPEDAEAIRPAPLPEVDFKLEANTIEAEGMRLDRKFGGGEIALLDVEAFPGAQLGAWQWKGMAKGDFVKLGAEVRGSAEWTVAGRFWCYPGGPTLQLSVSGIPLGQGKYSLDAEEAGWKLIEFGPMILRPREHILLLGIGETGPEDGPGLVFDYLLMRPKK